MGEAKKRRSQQPSVVYHHTSTLRTNLIWMSGVIELEGNSKGAFHPDLGEIQTDVTARRPCIDFPPLAWFSRSIVIPKCLQEGAFLIQPRSGGERTSVDLGIDKRLLANGIALNRIALGFPLEGSPIVPWKEHFGYNTAEGRALNESARHAGDDPDLWYVSEEPIDVKSSTEVWISPSKLRPKLERHRQYLKEVHAMVDMCRAREGVYIPPSWLTVEQAQALAKSAGLNVDDNKPSTFK